jgi:hypothetical protein
MEHKIKKKLEQALWNCKTIKARSDRDVVISGLSDELAEQITRSDDDHVDVGNILSACLDYPEGMKQLIDMIRYLEGNTKTVKTLEKLWRNSRPPISAIYTNLIILAAVWVLLYAYAIISGQLIPHGIETILALSPALIILGWILWTIINTLYHIFIKAVDHPQSKPAVETK